MSGGASAASAPAAASARFSRSASLADSASVASRHWCRSWRPAPGGPPRSNPRGSTRTGRPWPRGRGAPGRRGARTRPGRGHPDPVAPGRLQLLHQRLGEAEHDILLEHAAHRDGAGIGAAVAGIDHDQRALVGRFRRGAAGLGGGGIRGGRRLAEGVAVGALERDREQHRAVAGPRHRLDPADGGGGGEVDHDAGAAWGEQAVAEGLDEPVAAAAGPGFELEVDLGQVDHRPVRPLHHEAAGLDGPGQGQGQARAAGLAREVGPDGDGGLLAVLRGNRRSRQGRQKRHGQAKPCGTDQARAVRHRSGVVSRALRYGMGPTWLTDGCRRRFDPGARVAGMRQVPRRFSGTRPRGSSDR